MHLDDVPEEYEGVLDCTSLAICSSFNRLGTLLAVGCNDGRIVIWDFLTRGIAKHIPAHVNHPICSVSWSRDGHKLVTASLDNTIAIWRVLSAECLMRWKFPSPILRAQFNPRNERFVLVSPMKHPPILVEINYEQATIISKILPVDREEADLNIVATYDRRGKYIYTGNAKGRVAILSIPRTLDFSQSTNETSVSNLKTIASFRIQTSGSTPAAIKEIEFSARDKTYFLVNASDRTIRLFNCQSALGAGLNGACEELRKFQDLVNKTMWRRCCFSGNASHVCGGSTRQHALHIWDTHTGVCKKVLIGTKGELLLDIQWHPVRPVVASISSGLISVWARPQFENWSALAPDFRELEENMEYDERESEFDDEDEDNKPMKVHETDVDVIEDVDVTHVETNKQILSSDEDEFDQDALEVIPITLSEISNSSNPDSMILFPLKPEDQIEAKQTIKITLENPPIDEPHPLTATSTKRIRVIDKLGVMRKIPRNA